MSSPVKIVAVLEAKPDCQEDLQVLLRSMIEPSRAEAGCLRYDLWRDPQASGRFVLDELYTDDAAVLSHRATPHFQAYLLLISDLAVRSAHVLHPVDIAT